MAVQWNVDKADAGLKKIYDYYLKQKSTNDKQGVSFRKVRKGLRRRSPFLPFFSGNDILNITLLTNLQIERDLHEKDH